MAETFSDNREAGRFELDVEGHLAWADYRRRDGQLVIPHVEAEPALRGHIRRRAAGAAFFGLDLSRKSPYPKPRKLFPSGGIRCESHNF